jgi:hypothetical protein
MTNALMGSMIDSEGVMRMVTIPPQGIQMQMKARGTWWSLLFAAMIGGVMGACLLPIVRAQTHWDDTAPAKSALHPETLKSGTTIRGTVMQSIPIAGVGGIHTMSKIVPGTHITIKID